MSGLRKHLENIVKGLEVREDIEQYIDELLLMDLALYPNAYNFGQNCIRLTIEANALGITKGHNHLATRKEQAERAGNIIERYNDNNFETPLNKATIILLELLNPKKDHNTPSRTDLAALNH